MSADNSKHKRERPENKCQRECQNQNVGESSFFSPNKTFNPYTITLY